MRRDMQDKRLEARGRRLETRDVRKKGKTLERLETREMR